MRQTWVASLAGWPENSKLPPTLALILNVKVHKNVIHYIVHILLHIFRTPHARQLGSTNRGITLTYNCSSSAFRGILTIRQHWWLFLTSSAQGLGTGLQSKMYKGLYNGHENGNGNGSGIIKETES